MSQHPLMTAHDALLQAIEAYNAETNDYNEVVEERNALAAELDQVKAKLEKTTSTMMHVHEDRKALLDKHNESVTLANAGASNRRWRTTCQDCSHKSVRPLPTSSPLAWWVARPPCAAACTPWPKRPRRTSSCSSATCTTRNCACAHSASPPRLGTTEGAHGQQARP